MSANQLLHDEQITLMHLAKTSDVAEVRKLWRKLIIVRKTLDAHPYLHRPYYPRKLAKSHTGHGFAGSHAALGVWENDGGHVVRK